MKKKAYFTIGFSLFLSLSGYAQSDWVLVEEMEFPMGDIYSVIYKAPTWEESERLLYWGVWGPGADGSRVFREVNRFGEELYNSADTGRTYLVNSPANAPVMLEHLHSPHEYHILDFDGNVIATKSFQNRSEGILAFFPKGITISRDGYFPHRFYYSNPSKGINDKEFALAAMAPEIVWNEYWGGFFNSYTDAVLTIFKPDLGSKNIVTYLDANGNVLWERLKHGWTWADLSLDGGRIALITGMVGEPSRIEIVSPAGGTLAEFEAVISRKADAFSQTGEYLVLTDGLYRITVYRAETGEIIKSFIPAGSVNPVRSTAVDDDADLLYVIRQDDPRSGNRYLEAYPVTTPGFEPVWSYDLGPFDLSISGQYNLTRLTMSGDGHEMTVIHGNRQMIFRR